MRSGVDGSLLAERRAHNSLCKPAPMLNVAYGNAATLRAHLFSAAVTVFTLFRGVPPVAGLRAVRKRPLGLPFGVVAGFLFPLPLHLSPRPQEY